MPDRRRTAQLAADALAAATGLDVVTVRFDRSPMLAAVQIHPDEHARRQHNTITSVIDTGLLHGLWLLSPFGVTPRDQIPAVKQGRLDRAPQHVTRVRGGYRRLYQPPATLRAVGFRGVDTLRAVRRALQYPPIVWRYAIIDRLHATISSRTAALATEWEVGVLALAGDSRFDQLVPPGSPHTGVPGVYRWWIAEHAYAAWLASPLARASVT